jgi:hypothetical protein
MYFPEEKVNIKEQLELMFQYIRCGMQTIWCCDDCRFWEESDETCRRLAPMADLSFPKTTPTMWCGEFRPLNIWDEE